MAEHARTVTGGQYLTLALADELYGIGVRAVREIVEYMPVTRLPGAPPHVRGAITLRGDVVPVVDLRTALGLPASLPTQRSCIVVVESALQGEQIVTGLIVDAVIEVIELHAEHCEPVPRFGSRARPDALLGLAVCGERFIPVLDIEAVLTPRTAGGRGLGERIEAPVTETQVLVSRDAAPTR